MKTIMNKLITSLFLTLLISTSVNAANQQPTESNNDIIINNPWIRTAPPNAPMLGMFMQIKNNTNTNVKLIAIHIKGYDSVEIHKTSNVNGLMKMEQQPFAPVLAHKSLLFKPGSWHVMLINPKHVPKEGSNITAKLEFDNGVIKTVLVPVKRNNNQKNCHHHEN